MIFAAALAAVLVIVGTAWMVDAIDVARHDRRRQDYRAETLRINAEHASRRARASALQHYR